MPTKATRQDKPSVRSVVLSNEEVIAGTRARLNTRGEGLTARGLLVDAHVVAIVEVTCNCDATVMSSELGPSRL